MNNFQFCWTPEVKIWDESGAEEVRDGPMVCLAKMILINRPFE